MFTRLGCACALLVAAATWSACDEKLPVPPAPAPPPPPVSVSIVPGARTLTTTAFSPNPLNIPRGTTVTWVNNDTSTHNATSPNGFNTPSIPPGGQASVTLPTPGTFQYLCTIHPGMVGTINVQ